MESKSDNDDEEEIIIKKKSKEKLQIKLYNPSDITKKEMLRFLTFCSGNWDNNIEKTCIEWNGKFKQKKKNRIDLEPMFSFKGSDKKAKRISLLFLEKRDIGKKTIENICENNSCVNPKHLKVI